MGLSLGMGLNQEEMTIIDNFCKSNGIRKGEFLKLGSKLALKTKNPQKLIDQFKEDEIENKIDEFDEDAATEPEPEPKKMTVTEEIDKFLGIYEI